MAESNGTPIDIARRLAEPATYEDAILRVFARKRQRGMAFHEADAGVSYFSTATGRHRLAQSIARTVAGGGYRPRPVDLWELETNGKQRAAHTPSFIDLVVGSTLYTLLTHNAQCHGLPGVYSYLPGSNNVSAVRALAGFVRAHRSRVGNHGPPLYVLQSDFEAYGDHLPVGPGAVLWEVLRDVAALGSPDSTVAPHVWTLITGLARPVVRDADGTLFTRLRGVPMGSPLVPLLGNLAVLPMDRAVLDIDGIFYARYNDDFLLAHGNPEALIEADARIDALCDTLGVTRKTAKERRTALSGNGRPALKYPAYRGRNRIDYLGLSVSHAGTTAPAPHRLRRLVARLAARIDAATPALTPLPERERAQHLVAATNVMLDPASPFAVPGLTALLDTTTDRNVLADLDYRVARKIAQRASGRSGVRGFRTLPPAVLHRELGLVSLVRVRNLR